MSNNEMFKKEFSKLLDDSSKDEYIKKLENENKALKNRCAALTHLQVCIFCPMECSHRGKPFRGSKEE